MNDDDEHAAEIFVSLALANILLPFCLHEPTHTARSRPFCFARMV